MKIKVSIPHSILYYTYPNRAKLRSLWIMLKIIIFFHCLFLFLVFNFTLGTKQKGSCYFLEALQKHLNIHCAFVILTDEHLLSKLFYFYFYLLTESIAFYSLWRFQGYNNYFHLVNSTELTIALKIRRRKNRFCGTKSQGRMLKIFRGPKLLKDLSASIYTEFKI